MKGVDSISVLLLLILVQNTWQTPIQDSDSSRALETAEKQPVVTPNMMTDVKRHSEGTFSSDYSKYLDSRRAKDFVQWLMSTKRNGANTDKTKRHADGSYTSDVESLSDYFKAKRFVDSLTNYNKHQSDRRMSKRNADRASHTEEDYPSDFSSYLEAKAARDFINWLIKGRGRRDFAEESREIENEVIAEELDRRHADGTFTSEINVVLDTMAAKEFLNWIINSKNIQSRDAEKDFFNEYKGR
uniref:Proglucagon n=1 Tax=Callorhinchus milii TaxID=7868 RepID=V9KW24_CALMI